MGFGCGILASRKLCIYGLTLVPSASLVPRKLVVAPIWVRLRNVPPELFSFEGLSIIGSALGDPLYTEKPTLVPNALGLVKIKVVVILDQQFPSSLCVKDQEGTSVIVGAEFLRVPPKCELCAEFGHRALRCPRSLLNRGMTTHQILGRSWL